MRVVLNPVQSRTGTMGQVTGIEPGGEVAIGSTITVTYLSVQPPVTITTPPPAQSTTAPPANTSPTQTSGALPSLLPTAPGN